MPVAIGPEEENDKCVLPGKKDSFEQSQGVGDDASVAETGRLDGKPDTRNEQLQKNDSAAARPSLLQDDPDDQSIARPPLGN